MAWLIFLVLGAFLIIAGLVTRVVFGVRDLGLYLFLGGVGFAALGAIAGILAIAR